MKLLLPGITLVLLSLAFWSSQARADQGFLLMASTIGPIDAGIVPVLEDAFEKETGIQVRHVGAGTGEALQIAKKGSVDLALVHAKSLEEAFVKEGFGTERIPLMYNDFVIVGPAADPAGIKGMKSAKEALKQLAVRQSPFVSRGDKSGTHVAELELWKGTGVIPGAPWYSVYEKGNEGNVPTLRYTDQRGAYTVIDRATYHSLKDAIKLVVLVEGDEVLLNRISLIPVNPKKFPTVHHAEALQFVAWLTDPAKGQRIIAEFGKEKYGAPLFFSDSRLWHASHR
ncbi:tungsten ABC transporter substrate-binding protein [Geomonas silvestris]|uniref:Tungsten ABC transporter substrate-binding protein n=1 Tax=Geomonas silvestris TaxID=2740184 RepID=A0A6V8MKP1_9BACT|nr:substrate-binding domain-containing protein [Geomonas silvestris]GFO60494.1 tungsten ABC transporter substrate-binding protein [Geomonas silvestris]